jgi:hypothetical protein
MKHRGRWLAVGSVVLGLQLTACHSPHLAHHAEHPAEVEPIAGTDVKRITLTEKAMQRLDVQTATLSEQQVSRAAVPRKVVPYAAIIYDPKGQTWIYTSPSPRTFVRHRVTLEYVEGDLAVLSDGPPAGTVVASRAVAELYGADFGVGH